MLYDQGRFDEAAAALAECYRLHTTCPVGVHTDVATAANDLAASERAAGRRGRARELHEEALRLRRASAGGGDGVAVAESLNNLANVEDDPRRAAALLREAVATRERVLGPDDPLTIQSQVNLARLCIRNGELDAARPLLERAVQASRGLGSLGAEALIHALASLADVALRLGDPAAARVAIDEAVQLERQRFGTEHPRLAAELELRARIHVAQGELAAAIADRREVLRVRSALVPAGHRDVAVAQVRLGAALATDGGVAEALPLLEAAVASHLAASPPRVDDLIEARTELATALERAGRDADAERVLLAALADCGPAPGRAAARDALHRRLAALCRRTGRDAEAARYEATPGSAAAAADGTIGR
jgi:tetratricopeptide (TPR) repeat protein